MAFRRILKTTGATLDHTFFAVDTEDETDPSGTPTYAVVDANGTSVASGNATVVGSGTGRVTAALAGQSTTKLLTVSWTATVAGASVTEVDEVEIVGGFFWTPAEGRGSDSSLADTAKYTTADIIAARVEVEAECETICDRAFVPRYLRLVLDGTGTTRIVLQHPDPVRSVADVRSLRRVSVAPDLDETFVDLSAAQLASVAVEGENTLVRTDGLTFTEGRSNVVVELEYGFSRPPEDLRRQSMKRLRTWLNQPKSGIPDRASSFTAGDGGTYRIDLPRYDKTGIPDVDAAYSRYSRRNRSGNALPASRTLTYQPQHFSLFHHQGAR